MISLSQRASMYQQFQPDLWTNLPTDSISCRYRNLLRYYLADGHPGMLAQAQQLGAAAMEEGLGLLELVDLHETALADVLEEGGQHGQALIQRLKLASRLLQEMLSPFEVSRLGCKETISSLRRLYELLDAEARRVAHLLHEDTAQILSVVYLELSEFSKSAPAPAAERINLIISLLDDVREQLRDVSHELRPLILDQLGLIPALRFLALGFRKRCGLDVAVQGELAERLPEAVEAVLYRTVQEALANVARHARASLAEVRLWLHNDSVYCVVSDNGIGFEVPGEGVRVNTTGWGLLGIDERVDSLGGDCRIVSRPGEGAQLQVAIPL